MLWSQFRYFFRYFIKSKLKVRKFGQMVMTEKFLNYVWAPPTGHWWYWGNGQTFFMSVAVVNKIEIKPYCILQHIPWSLSVTYPSLAPPAPPTTLPNLGTDFMKNTNTTGGVCTVLNSTYCFGANCTVLTLFVLLRHF